MLGEDGTEPDLVRAGPSAPLLDPGQVVLLGWGPDQAQPREREAIERLGLNAMTVDEVRASPRDTAERALAALEDRADRVLIHLTSTSSTSPTCRSPRTPDATRGCRTRPRSRLCTRCSRRPRLAALTITELNPDHVEEGAQSIERLARDIADGLNTTMP